MLELNDITKVYETGGETVHALKGIDLRFRESEFVSILGPSGCGKTTMLNIIGGLDRYTTGDLVINGKSTKEYRAKDWDTYRNHSVGFVFQSYNLIPHQTVLTNVELALTLSGVSKKARRKRAIEALKLVGLGDQLRKKPAEMSGGQMQRVAIARAIINNPDIILADEPTGALDTETSVQIMEILKEISKYKLVIMVTHNPDLANTYSTRIVRMIDGLITSDSMPLTDEEIAVEREKETAKREREAKKKHPKMKFSTSFGLSLRNLITKKGRTTLTAFAGSIGIIGIALIFAVSNGMTTYINYVQEETLSSYPLALEAKSIELGSMIETFMGLAESSEVHDNDAVYQANMLESLVNALSNLEATENDLGSFKKYLENRLADDNEDNQKLNDAINGIQYGYSISPLVYTENVDGTILNSHLEELMADIMTDYYGMNAGSMMNQMVEMNPLLSMMNSSSSSFSATLWQQMLPDKDGEPVNDLIKGQYDLVYGEWPDAYNEVVVILDSNNELRDLSLYALGLIPKEEIDAILEATKTKSEVKIERKSWTYKEICDRDYRVILPSDCYVYDEATGTYTDLRDTDSGLRYLYANGIPLKVTGIIRPNEDAITGMLNGSVGFTHLLTEHVIQAADGSEAVKAQEADPTTDIFTGLPFRENTSNMTDAEKEKEFRAYLEDRPTADLAETYIRIASIPDAEFLDQTTDRAMEGVTRESIEETMLTAMKEEVAVDEDALRSYFEAMSDDDLFELYRQAVREQIKARYAAQIQQQLGGMTQAQLAGALTAALPNYTTEQCAAYYDEVLDFSDSTYEDNLKQLGALDLEKPASINIYASTFENKDVIEEAIKTYNDSVDEVRRISYTDYVGLMMSSITTIINAITYVLIGFVAISLVVSSIMIGVITLISVQERTKEIGILRAIGASKRNVSSMFNAETVIIGFISGLLGVGITYLLEIPLNAILRDLTGIANLKAILPLPVAGGLVLISVLLTLIAGIIPSRSAAKKDPVVALRTE